MIDKGKYPVLGTRVSAVDYQVTVHKVLQAALDNRPFTVSALAVHGIMTGYLNTVHRRRLNGIDLVVPDGQPVRWALRLMYKVVLPDRVYGPELMLRLMQGAVQNRIPVYLYGSTEKTLSLLAANMQTLFPNLIIAGQEPSKFRRLSPWEKEELVNRITSSGARMVLVGLGCPRQEAWIYEYRKSLRMPLVAVGAAFDFHAQTARQAPFWMQRCGLEWFYRLVQEPKRLWRRYMLLNPLYVLALSLEISGLKSVTVIMPDGREPEELYG